MGHIVFRTLQIKGVAAMSKTVAIRRDGVFGELYTEPHNIRAVISTYRERVGCDYRTAWADWFDWALGLPSRRETMEMLKNLEIG